MDLDRYCCADLMVYCGISDDDKGSRYEWECLKCGRHKSEIYIPQMPPENDSDWDKTVILSGGEVVDPAGASSIADALRIHEITELTARVKELETALKTYIEFVDAIKWREFYAGSRGKQGTVTYQFETWERVWADLMEAKAVLAETEAQS